ncbi:MAG: dockerin type I repeat-containing protein [Oscillospiraceae bacterium]|nr:dockerin type I repeat-containing protein [Oscillospiraceae bacterium]
MKKSVFLSALIFTSVCMGSAALPINAGISAYSIENPESEPELYGLAFDLPAETLHTGEVRQILADWDDNCYLTEPLVIQSENNDIAAVYRDGQIFAKKSGTAPLYIRAKLNPEKIDLAPDDDGIRTVTAAVTVADDPDLTDAQQSALKRIASKEDGLSCQFSRAKAEIKGLLAADAPRLTLDAVNQMIAGSDSFEALFRKITDAQPFPDLINNEEFTAVEYWFDDKGTEKIMLIPDGSGACPQTVRYSSLNPDGSYQEARYLYPENLTETKIEPDPDEKDWVYMLYNHDTSDDAALYGLALELSADTMYVGEVRQICVTGDTEYYLPDSLRMHVSNAESADAAAVFANGQIIARNAGEATVSIEAKLDPEKVDLSPDDDGIRLVTKTVRVIDSNELTDAQKATLDVLEQMESQLSFPRRKAIVKGCLNADAPRLTREQIDRFIEESESPETLCRNIMDAQPFPDCIVNSGVIEVCYFLNDDGSERISMPCGVSTYGIRYERLNQDGFIEENRSLYPEPDDQPISPNPDYLYNYYHNIVHSPLSGDANIDLTVSRLDAVLLQKWLFASGDAQYIDGEAADLDQDGTLNAIDLTLLKRQLLRNAAE